MSWKVRFTNKAAKQQKALPESIRTILSLLTADIRAAGPVQGTWPNYSKLSDAGTHHCHLKNGRPSWVACWRVVKNEIQVVEVYYAGTREKAPY